MNKKSLISLISGMVFMATIFTSCAILPEEEENLELPIVSETETSFTTYRVKQDNIVSSISTFGSVVSKSSYDVAFPNSGTITEVNVSKGQNVNAGQKIASLVTDDSGEPKTITLTAPITGTITELSNITGGKSVKAGKKIATITGTGDVVIEVGTPQYESVNVGDTVVATVNGKEYNCRVIFSSSNKNASPTDAGLDSGFKGFAAKFTGGVPSGVHAGDLLQIYKELGRKNGVLTVPTTAVSEFDGHTYVYIWKDGYRQEVEVQLGIQSTTFYEVVSGLSAGDIVTY